MFPSRIASLGGGTGLQNNYSLEFDGTNDYVSVADSADLDGFSAMTLCAWVKANDDGDNNYGRIADKGHGDTYNLAIERGSEDRYYCHINNVTLNANSSSINYGTWQHIAMTYDSTGDGTGRIYIDGVLNVENIEFVGVVVVNNSQALEIGGDGTAGSGFIDGNIDEVSIWNKALSAGDISALYQARGTANLNDDGNSANLKGWWRMGDGTLDSFNLIADQVNPTLGSELITNGTMEVDDNWSNYNTPTTNERSTTQVHSGTYSRKFVTDSAYDGIISDGFDTVTGGDYHCSFWIYADDNTKIRIRIAQGDGSGDNTINPTTNPLIVTQDTWTKAEFSWIESSGGNSANVVFECGSGEIGGGNAGTFYLDDVSVRRINGNPGRMKNMASDDIVKDTP